MDGFCEVKTEVVSFSSFALLKYIYYDKNGEVNTEFVHIFAPSANVSTLFQNQSKASQLRFKLRLFRRKI
jgi:hypothetical protein